ncbi:hypothetical protein [Sphingomonas sp.]|uniref:hypothetical protein n=1 Tax=Sphingomonas sp. TaxID=28214 RepID=UPI0025CF496E|nr:hypothetical protein [Sphingomonas sp.]
MTLKHLFGLVIIVLGGCGSRPALTSCPAIESLNGRDPTVDARKAFTQGDRRLLMMGGIVGTIPGAENSNIPSRMLAGTSDTEPLACSNLRTNAQRYAETFNKEMSELAVKNDR